MPLNASPDARRVLLESASGMDFQSSQGQIAGCWSGGVQLRISLLDDDEEEEDEDELELELDDEDDEDDEDEDDEDEIKDGGDGGEDAPPPSSQNVSVHVVKLHTSTIQSSLRTS